MGEHEAGSYDTPTAPGVTVADWGSVSLGVPQMAVVGEPLHLMVSNFGQADNGYVRAGGKVKHIAQSFTTGSASSPYRLEGIAFNVEGSVDESMDPQVPDGPSSVSVAVHAADDSPNRVGIKLFDLVSPSEVGAGHRFFEAPLNTTLMPDTSYQVVWSYVRGTWHRLRKTLGDGEDSGPQAASSIGNEFRSGEVINELSHVPASSNALEIAVYGEPVDRIQMVSNLGQPDNGHRVVGDSTKVLSQAFTTRSGSSTLRFDGIGVNVEGSDDLDGNARVPGGATSVSVALHADSSGKPGIKLHDLVSPGGFHPGNNFFAAPPEINLAASTTYHVVWTWLLGSWHNLQKTGSDHEDSGGLTGFSIANALNGGADLDHLSADTNGDALEIVVYGFEGVHATPVVAGGYQVGINWLHIPDDAEVGDQFRVVFVSFARRDATSANIEDYNALVQEEAAWEGNHRIIRGIAPEFKAVVCTEEVDARENTAIEGAEHLPIYWVDGGWENRPHLLAHSYNDFFSDQWIETGWGAVVTGNSTQFYRHESPPPWVNPLEPFHPDDNPADPIAVAAYYYTDAFQMWTGCDTTGFTNPYAPMGSSMGTAALGDASIPWPNAGEYGPLYSPLGSAFPRSIDVDVTVDFLSADINDLHRFYAMSPVLTVVRFAEE